MECEAEPQYGAVMLEAIEIFGVDAFTQSAVTIKARIKTQPQQQDPVGREYRRRLKKAFDGRDRDSGFPRPNASDGPAAAARRRKPMKSRNEISPVRRAKIRSPPSYFGPGVYIRSHSDRHLI